jgi:hypothetical protein
MPVVHKFRERGRPGDWILYAAAKDFVRDYFLFFDPDM